MTTIQDRVLAVIASQPGGRGLQELRAELWDVSAAVVGNAVSDLHREGKIERIGHARYRLPRPKEPRFSVPISDSFVRAPSLARLMAGR
jgi:predicted transcriptional regulator of viral defense system